MTVVTRLDATISAVCPILGVQPAAAGTSVGPGNVVIDYSPAATAPQRTAAANAVAAFDWSAGTQATWDGQQTPKMTALRAAADQAVADCDAYAALVSPSVAQNTAALKKLIAAVRLLILWAQTVDGGK